VIHPEKIEQMNVVMNENKYLLRVAAFADRLIVTNRQTVSVAVEYASFNWEI
jgi:hypothetical protein